MSKQEAVDAIKDHYVTLIQRLNIQDKLTRVPPSAIDYFADNPYWLKAYPRIWEGELLKAQPSKNLVPNESVANRILLAGCQDYESLSFYTQEKMRALSPDWRSPVLIYPRQEDDGTSTFTVETDVLMEVYDFLSDHYQKKYRGTGEPRFAHEQRMILRALDVIREVNARWDRGEGLFNFTPESAKVWLLMVLAHDFIEKEKDAGEFDPKGWRKETRTHYVVDSNPTSQGYYFTEAMVHRDGRIGKVLKRLRINLKPYEMDALQTGLTALDSSGLDGEDTMHHLNTLALNARYGRMSEAMFRLLPFLTKVIDRDDNVATRTFKYNPRHRTKRNEPVFVARGHDGVIKKAQETINSFTRAEAMFMALAIPRHAYGTRQRMVQWVRDPNAKAYFKRMLPSRWAMLTLMGLGPNQIYANSPVDMYQPRVAEMI